MKDDIVKNLERIEHLSSSCVEHWKKGDDQECYKDFIEMVEELELLVEADLETFPKKELLSNIMVLCQDVRNQDMIGIIDVLAYDLVPLLQKWRRNGKDTNFKGEIA